MKHLYWLVIIVVVFSSCIKRVPLETANDLSDFEYKKELLGETAPSFFAKIDDSALSVDEAKYLKFIITYMPISDFADYDVEFFLRHVQSSIEARNTFTWGSEIPEEIFLHYVLPCRINNENMDTARMVFFRELKERLLAEEYSMAEAALEVNHWCHEKVIYQGTDERTISPLAIVRSAFGRCGEESTFTTTALRSVGIPARQVYTPRWAHTDDNHAWVEVWIDGKWNFLGACEPLPVLNTGWFALPASRTMLVQTKQFGYVENEIYTPLSETENYSWVNALETYAPTKTLRIRIIDENNLPVKNAEVRFQLYNYAEMYPIHRAKTDIVGYAEFTTGYGSLEVFVSDGERFTSQIIEPNQDEWIVIVLGKDDVYSAESCIYIPPTEGFIEATDEKLVKENAKRLQKEDRIRAEYISTFYKPLDADFFAETFKYPVEIADYLIKSRGNWEEIEKFLIESSYQKKQKWAFELIKAIAEKDLRDTDSEILGEHLNYAINYLDESLPTEIFVEYVLNPRIRYEMLKPYRELIISSLSEEQISNFRNNPAEISAYISSKISKEITIKNESISVSDINAYRIAITPAGVHKLKLADEKSYKIYFVAFCRSLGIPARIDFASGYAQYYNANTWFDVVEETSSKNETVKRGKLKLISADTSRNLKYRIHFSIAKLENGFFNTVDLGWEIPISDFSDGLELPIGEYMLLTSLRIEGGSIIVNREYFDLYENEILQIEVELPKDIDKADTYKNFVHNSTLVSQNNTISSLSLCEDTEYTVFIWLDAGREPSKHIVRDLAPMIDELNKNNIETYFLVDEQNFNPTAHGFPTNLNYIFDADNTLLYSNTNCKISGQGLVFPQIFMLNKENKIIFSSKGYTIAVGELFLNAVEE